MISSWLFYVIIKFLIHLISSNTWIHTIKGKNALKRPLGNDPGKWQGNHAYLYDGWLDGLYFDRRDHPDILCEWDKAAEW